MSGYDRWRRLRHAAMAVRVGVPVLLGFLSAPASFVSGPVGDAHAQQQPAGKAYRIGFLSQGQPPKAFLEALQHGLRERGYAEGRNLVWEFRSTDGSLGPLPQFAEDLVRLKVDVILARASSGAMAAKRATTSIPIVFFAVYAPVEIGLVPNLGHPGGNITGVAVNASDMAGKRVQLLKELVPTLKRVAFLSHPSHPTNAVQLQGAEAAARTLAVHLKAVPVRGADDFAPALSALRGIEGVLHADTPLFVTHRARLVDAVAGSRLPAIYPARVYVEAGGLMSYGPNLPDLWRRAAAYVKVDAIVTQGTQATDAARRAVTAIPIVFAVAGDPVGTGLVTSLARPGGNVTGLTDIAPEIAGKRLELLREAVPGITRIAVLWNPANPWQEHSLAPARAAIQQGV